MTGHTHRLDIGLIIRAAFRQRDDVITNRGGCDASMRQAEDTERLVFEQLAPAPLQSTATYTRRLEGASPVWASMPRTPSLANHFTTTRLCARTERCIGHWMI